MSVCLQKGPQSFLSLHPHYYETLQPFPTLNQAGLEFCFNHQNLPEVLSQGFERPVGPHYFLSLIKRTARTRCKAMGSRDKPPWLRPLQASQPAADSTADQGDTCEPSALRNHLAELSSNCPPAELGQGIVNARLWASDTKLWDNLLHSKCQQIQYQTQKGIFSSFSLIFPIIPPP